MIHLQDLLHNLTINYNDFTKIFDELINSKAALREGDTLTLSKVSKHLLEIIDSLKKDTTLKEPGDKHIYISKNTFHIF